jgi:broad specificity phosphatase PhoE
MEILLLRHGQTDWNLQRRCQGISDLELNGSGVQQALEVAAALRYEPIRIIMSSPLKRAVQTAEVVRQRHADVPIIVDKQLRELDHGYLEGLTFDEIKEKYPEFMARWRVAPASLPTPGGESLADVDARAWEALQRVIEIHSTGTVVLVTHNFPILSILCRITATDLNDYRRFRAEPCALTRIRYDKESGWQLFQPSEPSRAAAAPLDQNRL